MIQADRVGPTKSEFRTDIQALRGYAVLLVLLYHSGLGLIPAGYLGVDVFFVISGFLITGIVRRAIDERRFSLLTFYAQRARRLLPAALVVLPVTSVASAFVLTSTRYDEYVGQLVGSIFFVANVVMWRQTGYFSTDAIYKPLLHMWSLAIEEQYYLLLPIMLVLAPVRWRLPLILAGTLASLVACLVIVGNRPSFTFYMLPTRAWELGIGSLTSFLPVRSRTSTRAKIAAAAALAILVLVPLWPLPGPVPGWSTLAVCTATAVIIAVRAPIASRVFVVRSLARVGDFSYSLYLVHWPIFALVRSAYLTARLPVSLSLSLIVASLVLAYLLYVSVEEPIRRTQPRRRWIAAGAVSASLAVIAATVAFQRAKPAVILARQALAPVAGLPGTHCFSEDTTRFDGRCHQFGEPKFLLWGDSYSTHLVPGLVATSQHPFAQASKGHCTPLANYAAVAAPNEHGWTEGCLAFNRSVIDYLRTNTTVRLVLISGNFARTLEEASAYAIRRVGDRIERVPLGIDAAVDAMRETVAAIRALGHRVVVISPPPPNDFDMGQCWERQSQGLPLLGPLRGCRLDLSRNPAAFRSFERLMDGFSRHADVPVIRLDHALCNGSVCASQVDGRPLFVDSRHLTELGSRHLGTLQRWGEAIQELAR